MFTKIPLKINYMDECWGFIGVVFRFNWDGSIELANEIDLDQGYLIILLRIS